MHDLGDLVVDGVDGPEAVAEAGEALAGEAQRLVVAVDADEHGVREALEGGLRVPAHAERPVDDDGAGPGQGRGEQVEDPVAQDGDVPLLRWSSIGHRASFCCGGCRAGPERVRERVVRVPPADWSPSAASPGTGEVVSGWERLEAGSQVVGLRVIGTAVVRVVLSGGAAQRSPGTTSCSVSA